MSVTHLSTMTCDAGGETETASDSDEFHSSRFSIRWATLEWEEDPRGEEKNRDWKSLHLCPEHLEQVLQLIMKIKTGKT